MRLPLASNEQEITPDQRTEIETEKAKTSQRLTFERLGLRPGTALQFIKDYSVTCEIVSLNRVRFRDEVMSLSGAALRVLHELGFNWSACAGPEYWTYEGFEVSAMATQS
ncbi:MAG: hypothetical protein ACYDD1_03725 [Caulobacteraceae bacterium]